MRIALITTMYKRPELTRFVFDYYNTLKNNSSVEIILCVAGSEGDESKTIARENGFNYIECPNLPLNQKHNTVLQFARGFNPDAVVLIGSDDLLSANLFDIYADQARLGVDVFGFTDIYFYNRQLYHWKGYKGERRGESVGAGRMFGRKLLDRMDWNLWGYDELNSGLDSRAAQRVSTFTNGLWPQPLPDGHMILGIKAGQSITPINELEGVEKISGEKLRYLQTDLTKLNHLYE